MRARGREARARQGSRRATPDPDGPATRRGRRACALAVAVVLAPCRLVRHFEKKPNNEQGPMQGISPSHGSLKEMMFEKSTAICLFLSDPFGLVFYDTSGTPLSAILPSEDLLAHGTPYATVPRPSGSAQVPYRGRKGERGGEREEGERGERERGRERLRPSVQ
jgi:hypothetical protein